MFERFTKPARLVVGEAVEVAQTMGHKQFGSDHMLLALAGQPGQAAGQALSDLGVRDDDVREAVVARHGGEGSGLDDEEALRTLGIDLSAVRAKVEETFGEGALDAHRRHRGRPRLSSEGKKTLELALREAVRLKDHYIGAEHLLLGILRAEGPGHDVLRSLGVDVAALRRRVETDRAA